MSNFLTSSFGAAVCMIVANVLLHLGNDAFVA
jgi:hypothetical protein